MVQESIVFAPELDERQLDSEVGKVDETLNEVGNDVPVSFNPDEEMGMDGLAPPGADGGGMPGDGPGVGGAAGIGAVASKIPKPVAGVAASAALPVALAGGVGVKMLGAMTDASARLQTSANILGTAKDNFFREPGNVLDENIVRPLSKDLLNLSTDFSEIAQGGLGQGLSFLLTGDDPRNKRGPGERAGAVGGTILGVAGGAFAGAKAGGAGGAALGSIIPGAGTAAGGIGGAIIGGITGAIAAAPIGGRIGSALGEKVDDFQWPDLPEFSWPNIPQFPGWPNIKGSWNGWPELGVEDVMEETFGVSISGMDIIEAVFPTIRAGRLAGEIITGNGGGGGGGDGFLDDLLNPNASAAQGGRVQQSGVAQIHKGELIADEQRLVDELASAIGQTSGGGGGADTSAIESKLDRLHSDLQQLRNAMDVSIQIDKETLGRATNDARRNRMGDTDPTV